MNAPAHTPDLLDDIVEVRPTSAPTQSHAMTTTGSATPADLVRYALDNNADVDKLERLMNMQIQWEQREAKKAYDRAFAAFKAEAVKIIKNRNVTAGPLSGKKYAELFAVVNAVTPALSAHGLSSSWKLTRDEKDWLEVTCYLKHVDGHTESVSMGGPPDAGGAKNPIQARASTKTYLERYTLKAITGLSEQEDDDDGTGNNARRAEVPAELLQQAREKSLEGWKALAAWIRTLTEAQREMLEPESANLKAAAKAADERSAK